MTNLMTVTTRTGLATHQFTKKTAQNIKKLETYFKNESKNRSNIK